MTNPQKILLNLCKGAARSKVFCLILLAVARENYGILSEKYRSF